MVKTLVVSRFAYWILFLYLIVLVWWIKLYVSGSTDTSEAYLFNWFYGLIALSGAIYGIKIAVNKWGGWGSVLGRGLILLPLGLLGQWFGLQVWTYYNVILKVEIPYPSLADLGYFALIPAYSLGAWMFALASGAKFSLRTSGGKIIALFIPLIAVAVAYALFVKDIGPDFENPLRMFLDFGYPLGEIIPVSIALFTLTLAGSLLGGVMRGRIVYLVGAFFFQFITEYAFIYTSGVGTYVNGGWNDLMYATSYAIMSLGLISFKNYD